MSQHAVERTLGKLLTDESFREDIELAALSELSRSALGSFSATLDPRICRLCLATESSPEEEQP